MPFVEHYVLAMGAAIWSADPGAFDHVPARFFIRFFDNHGLLTVNDRPTWHVIKGGSRSYIEPLVKPFKDKIRLNAPVESIRRFPDRVVIETACYGAENYDAVFIATHTNEALRMLERPTVEESNVLGAISRL